MQTSMQTYLHADLPPCRPALGHRVTPHRYLGDADTNAANHCHRHAASLRALFTALTSLSVANDTPGQLRTYIKIRGGYGPDKKCRDARNKHMYTLYVSWEQHMPCLQASVHAYTHKHSTQSLKYVHQLLYASLSLWLAQELLLIHLWINAWRAGTRARAPLRCELTGIVAPRVLHVFVPLLWDEHKPLLTRRLVVFRIRLPCPEERTGWGNLFGAGAALVVDGQRWQLEELSLRWEELRGEKWYGGKQKLACRLVAMQNSNGQNRRQHGGVEARRGSVTHDEPKSGRGKNGGGRSDDEKKEQSDRSHRRACGKRRARK